jgi:hypothetical protein
VSLAERVVPEVHRRAPRASRSALTSDDPARVGGACGPSGATRGGLSCRPHCSARGRRCAWKTSTDRSGAFDDDPPCFERTPLLDGTLHGSRLLVRELLGVHRLKARQDLGRGDGGIVSEPGCYLLLQVIQHRRAPRHRLTPPIGAAMGRTLFALAPGYRQRGDKPLEIDWSSRLVGSLQPASVDPLAELALRGADLSDQLYWIGLGLEAPQCRLSLLGDRRVGQNSSCWECRGVVAFDDPGANAGLLLELEGRLKQIGVPSGGSVEPHQSRRRSQALQPAIAD